MPETVTVSYEGLDVGADVFLIDWCENTVLRGVVQQVHIGYGPWDKEHDKPTYVAEAYQVSFYAGQWDQDQEHDCDPDKDGVVIRYLDPEEVFETQLEAWEFLREDLANDVKEHNKNFGKLMADIQRVEETLAKVRERPYAKI